MDSIKIGTVVMPRVRAVAVGGVEVCNEITMASGKSVKEMIGFRATVAAEWDWLPAATITALHTLLRQGGYFYVEYPDPTGVDKAGYFSVSYPETRVFRFVNGVARWHGVSLTMTAQEVV